MIYQQTHGHLREDEPEVQRSVRSFDEAPGVSVWTQREPELFQSYCKTVHYWRQNFYWHQTLNKTEALRCLELKTDHWKVTKHTTEALVWSDVTAGVSVHRVMKMWEQFTRCYSPVIFISEHHKLMPCWISSDARHVTAGVTQMSQTRLQHQSRINIEATLYSLLFSSRDAEERCGIRPDRTGPYAFIFICSGPD